MSALDREVLAEKAAAVQRHLARVAGHIEGKLASRLERAAGSRNLVAHAYERLDMARVHCAARESPDDLRAFLGALSRLI